MGTELILSVINERRLGPLASGLEQGTPGRLFSTAKWARARRARARASRADRGGPRVHHLASLLYLAAGLLFRYAWVGAGRASARDDRAVARDAPLGVRRRHLR